ncbi:unnamed protein product, partial [Phaeothamnion confervicola]
NVDARSPTTGRAALHESAVRGDNASAALLLKAGASVGLRTFLGGDTPLHLAAAAAVARPGARDVAALLVQHGADLDATNRYGQTALHYTTSPLVVKLLITRGASV